MSEEENELNKARYRAKLSELVKRSTPKVNAGSVQLSRSFKEWVIQAHKLIDKRNATAAELRGHCIAHDNRFK